MQSVDQRLQDAMRKKSRLEAHKNRVQGRLESAQKTLSEVQQACRDKGVDPDRLDEVIEKLEERYVQTVETLEQEVESAKSQLMPFLED